MTAHAIGAWSYRPGAWFGIFGPTATLLLPGTEKERVATLWSLVDDGAGFDRILDTLLESGLGMLPGFVLVGTDDGPTKVLVRGADVRASLTTAAETVEIDGSTVSTWVERTLDGVVSLTVSVDGHEISDDGSAYPIDGGLVRVSRIDQPSYAAPVPAPPGPSATEGDTGPGALLGDPLTDPLTDDAAAQPVDPDVDPAPQPAETEVFDLPPMPTDEDPDTTDVGLLPAQDADPVAPLPPPPPPPPVAPEGTDHDGLTRAGVDADEFARPQPGIPGQPMAPSVTRSVAKLVISSGETIDVDRVVLVGRAPEARRFTSTEQPRLITVPSPLHEISSTHIEIRPGSGADHGSAVVTDMGSTNGTVLEQPGLGPEDLKPGIAVQLIPGAIINLGDGVTIQVTRP